MKSPEHSGFSPEQKVDERRPIQDIVKEIDPELDKKMEEIFALVQEKANRIETESLDNPQAFSVALYDAIFRIMKEAKDKYGYVAYDMDRFIPTKHDSNNLSDDAGYALAYALLSKYAAHTLQGTISEFLEKYLQEAAAIQCLRKDSVPASASRIRRGLDQKNAFSSEHIIKLLREQISISESEEAAGQMKKFNDDLTIIHDYANTGDGKNELLNRLGINEKDNEEELSQLHHVAGSATGKGFGMAFNNAYEEFRRQ